MVPYHMAQYLANKITSILPISSATMDEVLIARRPHFSDADGGVLSYTYQQDNIVNQVFELLHLAPPVVHGQRRERLFWI